MRDRNPPEYLFWSVYYPPNFGDWVGPFLYWKLTGREPAFRRPGETRHPVHFTAGSILTLADSNSVVWGSGILSSKAAFPRPRRTCAVRGPRTLRRFGELGYPCPDVFGDPAILLPRVHAPRDPAARFRLGVIPHFRDLPEVEAALGSTPDVKIVDVRQAVERVVDDICACERTVSSSLHGLIVSHAYGVPSGWVRFSDRLGGDGVKFADYFESVGLEGVEPLRAPRAFDAASLLDHARSAPLPDQEPLRGPLLDACPFAPRKDAP